MSNGRRSLKQQGKQSDTDLLAKLLSSNTVHVVGNYIVGKTIGEGSFGKVKLGTHCLTGHEVAIKVVDKIHAAVVAREIETWRHLHHPNIAQLYEVLVTESKIYMITEYCQGGEAFDYLCEKGRLDDTDPRTRKMFREIVEAVAYCHQKNFVHRDLKLENVLLSKELTVKLIDFGFTRPYNSRNLLDTYCGSVAYAAPEMIQGKKYSGPEADIWSLGVILYTLLCGSLPFDDDNESIVHQKISELDYELPSFLTEESKSLISQILKINPGDRISVQDILRHSWFAPTEPSSDYNPLAAITPGFDTPEELQVVSEMHAVGMDVERILESVCGDACDSASALWYLLLAKKREGKRANRSVNVSMILNDGEEADLAASRTVGNSVRDLPESSGSLQVLMSRRGSAQQSVLETLEGSRSDSNQPRVSLPADRGSRRGSARDLLTASDRTVSMPIVPLAHSRSDSGSPRKQSESQADSSITTSFPPLASPTARSYQETLHIETMMAEARRRRSLQVGSTASASNGNLSTPSNSEGTRRASVGILAAATQNKPPSPNIHEFVHGPTASGNQNMNRRGLMIQAMRANDPSTNQSSSTPTNDRGPISFKTRYGRRSGYEGTIGTATSPFLSAQAPDVNLLGSDSSQNSSLNSSPRMKTPGLIMEEEKDDGDAGSPESRGMLESPEREYPEEDGFQDKLGAGSTENRMGRSPSSNPVGFRSKSILEEDEEDE